MRFNDFVSALQKAGWDANRDAQHSEIKKLWRKLFPVVAQLEDDLAECRYVYEENHG